MNIAGSYHGDYLELDSAASGLQALSWNDNGWDQGQLFMTPDKVWLQPYGWSQSMLSQHKQFIFPLKVTNTTSEGLDVGSYLSEGGAVGIRAVNWWGERIDCSISISWRIASVPTLE